MDGVVERGAAPIPEAEREALSLGWPRASAERSQSLIMTTVDARGLICPLPLTLAKRKMADLRPGEQLLLLATDREAPIDVGAWAADCGHGYRRREVAGWTEFTITKGVTRSVARG